MNHKRRLHDWHEETVASVASELLDLLSERITEAVRGVDVEFRLPAGHGFAYARRIKGYIVEVLVFYVEVQSLHYAFMVRGTDQCGRSFSGSVPTYQLDDQNPWDKVLREATSAQYEVIRKEQP